MNRFVAEFFENNRKKLSKELPNSLILISANSILQKSADTPFPFRQDSNFWYLTGISEPDLILVIDTSLNRTIILMPTLNDYQKEWDGDFDIENLSKLSGIKDFESQVSLTSLLKKTVVNKQNIAYLKPLDEYVQPYGFYSNPARRKLSEKILRVTKQPIDIRLEIARLRQVKQPVELEAIRQAIDVTGKSIEEVKLKLSSFHNESDINNQLTAGFYSRGAEGHGYEPIIASGANAAIIHYKKNNNIIVKNSFLLLDVGAQVDGYSADISRTWAVGKVSAREKQVHDAVMTLQNDAFLMLKPGVMLRDFQEQMEKKAKQSLKKLRSKYSNEKYPHGFSHFLGLDVHDAGDYESPLIENSVITIEPGIYLRDEGIGVRIEDNLLITKTGIEILSKNIPRSL